MWMRPTEFASSYMTMTCLEMAFIVNVPVHVYIFTYKEITGFLHSATYA